MSGLPGACRYSTFVEEKEPSGAQATSSSRRLGDRMLSCIRPINYSLALQNVATFCKRSLVTGTDDTLNVLKVCPDQLAARATSMSCHLRGGTLPSLASKQSLPGALQTRAAHRPAPHLRASRTAVVVRALQKTRVVRGKCYVTKDVSSLSLRPLLCNCCAQPRLGFAEH